MTLYIVGSKNPDTVTRFDNVLCLEKKSNGTIEFWTRVTDTVRLCHKLKDVISLESN